MNIPITTPALLFPAIAILMLGYINRYLGIASLIRTVKKDYDRGYKRVAIIAQINILKRRAELSRYMLEVGALAMILACLSMFLIFANRQDWGDVAFGLSLLAMIVSLFLSFYETALSNKSLLMEVEDILKKESE